MRRPVIIAIGLATVSLAHLWAQTVPDAPTIGTAVAIGRATVTFTAPADDGGSPITVYTATSSPGGLTGTITGEQKTDNPALPIHVEGLTGGTSYTFTVTATNAIGTSPPSDASNSVTPSADLVPTAYSSDWSVAGAGTIPARTTICATIDAATYGDGTLNATAGIQAAIDACPADQTVKLGAGVFLLNDAVLLRSNRTLRGNGTVPDVGLATATILYKSDAKSKTGPSGEPLADESQALIVIGPNRFASTTNSTAVNLTADAVQGDTTISISSTAGMAVGEVVKIDADDYTTSTWGSFPIRSDGTTPLITLFSDRFWLPIACVPGVDGNGDSNIDCTLGTTPGTATFPNRTGSLPVPGGLDDYSRSGRFMAEIHEIASIDGNDLTFTTALHNDYPVAKAAQVVRYTGATNLPVFSAGLEDLTLIGGSEGNVFFANAVESWVKNIESNQFGGVGVELRNSYRCTVRDSWLHDNHQPEPGGGGYVFGLKFGSSEILVENNILMSGNKAMVSRASGSGSVVGYNYVDNAYIGSNLGWMETGLNASHMVGSNHVLFEGNLSFNYDNDDTWGSSIYNVVFRNHFTGERRDFPNNANGTGNIRAGGLAFGVWWNAFFGNVLGESGMTGWVYEDPVDGTYGNSASTWGGKAIWRIGYTAGPKAVQYPDPMVRSTAIRDGNYDYVSDAVHWDRTNALTIPDSLYLAAKPAFFDAGQTWPWVDAEGATKLYELPAKVRAESYLAARTAPLAPHINTVIRTGDTTVSVRFAPPYYNGGAIINNYTVTSSPGGITAVRAGVTAKNDPITVTGLTLDETYTFTVTAGNAIGTGPASAASDPITLDVPGPEPGRRVHLRFKRSKGN